MGWMHSILPTAIIVRPVVPGCVTSAAERSPMLPITHGEDFTRRRIVMYALSMVPVALVPAVLASRPLRLAVLLWHLLTPHRHLTP